MPFNVSNPVFLYNKKAFTKAGLDPNSPPQTLDQVMADAIKLKAAGAVAKAGFGLKTDPWFLEQWLAKAGNPYVNNGNGRNARATQALFEQRRRAGVFAWMSHMVKSGNAVPNNYLTRTPSTTCSGSATATRDERRHVRDARHHHPAALERPVPERRPRRRPDARPAGPGRCARRRRGAVHLVEVGAGEAGRGVAVPEVPRLRARPRRTSAPPPATSRSASRRSRCP